MKLKKIFTFCLVLFVAFCLVGCGEAKTSHAVGNNLNKSVDNLSGVIDKLEEVNYNDIVINDINPLSDNTFNTVSSKYTQKSKWYTVGAISENDKVKTNAKYVNAQKDNSKIGVTNKQNTVCEDGVCYDKSNTQNEICIDGVCYDNTSNSVTYKPKYVNNVSNSFVRTSLDNYIASIEVLYNDCADCISCEAECKNAKNTLCQNINDCKTLCQKLKDGTIELSESEITACNEYIKLLESYTNRLNTTKGNIKTKVNNISKIKNNYNNQVESVKQAYENLLEALETRLECYNDCNNTVCNIQDIINKTNVNISEAEKNKSNSSDINQSYTEKLENVSNKTGNKTQIFNSNIKSKNTKTNTNRQNGLNQNKNQNNSATNNTQYSKKTNISNKNNNKQIQSNNSNQQITTNNTLRNKNTQPPLEVPAEQPQENTNNQNAPIINNGYTQYPNNNGVYNNGYANNAYPPRNIDTYQTINKNIDTYRPQTPIYNGNYVNQYPANNQYPVNNNQNTLKISDKNNTDNNDLKDNINSTEMPKQNENKLLNNKSKNNNKINSKTHEKDILDKQFIDHQKKITDKNQPMPYPYKNNEQIKQGSAENKVLVTDNTNQEKQIKENNDNAVNNNDENIDPNYNIMTLEEPVVDTTMQTQKNTDNTDQNNNLNFDKTINKNIIENNKNNNTTSNKNLNENNANVNIKELPKQLTKDIKEQPKENEFERNQLAGHKVNNDHNKPKIEGHRHREIN